MDRSQVARICAVFGLGEPLSEPRAVPGGLLHRVWRLATTQGDFAVKELNPTIAREPGIHEAYRRTERIAAAMAAAGVPAVAARDTAAGPVRTLDGVTLLVYPWVEGVALPITAVASERAWRIGAVLARMHALRLDVSGFWAPPWDVGGGDDWARLAERAEAQALPWAGQVRAALPAIAEWTALYRQALPTLRRGLIISHRDLGQKNVLWRDAQTFAIVDWESAGPINPAVELAGVALNWSGHAVGAPEEAAFVAAVAGYRAAGGVLHESGHDALAGCLGSWLDWLRFNALRALGEGASNAEERNLGAREVTLSLSALRSLAEHLNEWSSWLER